MAFEVSGDVTVPGDKSLSHRALMFAAAARGTSRLSGLLPGEDCRSTAVILGALGAQIPVLPSDGGTISISSPGLSGWRSPRSTLDCGNSGTTARLMLGLLAGLPLTARMTGDDSLRSRPMRRVTEPLSRMGATFHELGEPDRLPLEIEGGPLQTIEYRSPHASAQVKSAILLAGLAAGVPVSVIEPHQSRDHTERMLAALGAGIDARAVEGGWFVGMTPPAEPLPPLEMHVPGDPSSAAFLLALGLLAERGELRVRGVCLNPTRTGFIEVMRRMGGEVEVENRTLQGGETVGDLVCRPSRLRGTAITASEIPALIDEIPILAMVASRAHGETRITGAAELRAKESDRIAALVGNLRAIGGTAEELPDGLVVVGSDAPLRGRVEVRHDHRIAMAFGVLGRIPGNEIRVDHPEVVDVSFPGFWPLLDSLVAGSARSARPTEVGG
jgi:3-phosphoshikimate 1-carboxyvinyltransferase